MARQEWQFPDPKQPRPAQPPEPTIDPVNLYGEFLEEQRERRWGPFLDAFNRAWRLFVPERKPISEDWERQYRMEVYCVCGVPREQCANHKSPVRAAYWP